MTRVEAQTGYDALAQLYDEMFPDGYGSSAERHALAIFTDDVLASGLSGPVADVGCGTGHATADLAARGLDVVGVDPSTGMLALARERYPDLRWVLGDADLAELPASTRALSAVVARFSLTHVTPELVPGVLQAWSRRLEVGAYVLVAFQVSDDADDPVVEFDHRVAPAWRWHPEAMADALAEVGLSERWRMTSRPDGLHRFGECHLVARLTD